MKTVQFKVGEIIDGMEFVKVHVNELEEVMYLVRDVESDVLIWFHTKAGEGTNYSIPNRVIKNGRTYSAQRYWLKYVSLVQELSNILYQRYQEENTPLLGKESVISLLTDENITHQWVVIKPSLIRTMWKEEYHTKENQVVFATGGFGCKAGSLSLRGGKIYVNDASGINSQVYRNEVLGIAKQSVVDSLGLAAHVE